MVQRIHLRLTLLIFILIAFIFTYSAFAEIRVFEKEVEAIVGEGQAQSQVESFALQRAKRLAVEEAGTYLSSLSVVQNYQLQKDEVTALASGIVRTIPVGLASVREANGVTYVKIRAKIEVDTSVLDRQVKDIMKDKGTLKKLEETQQKVRELEEELKNIKSNSKSAELKRLEDMNSQALALERERDKQRLLREEQAIKARREMSKAEEEHFAKEREMQDRISKTLADQEKAKKEEAAVLTAEQDRIKRAQLENEQRWNNLARKAQLTQDQWVAIDNSLSLKQAIDETKILKQEIANLKKRLAFQYQENKQNLETAYNQQIDLTKPKLPPAPPAKDPFESTAEYDKRLADNKTAVNLANKENATAIDKIKAEENLNLTQSKVNYLHQQIRILEPFVSRLQSLQSRRFFIPEAKIIVELGAPDADNNRFPLTLKYQGKDWSMWWNYSDRKAARDFYNTRAYLKAEGIFQLEGSNETSGKLKDANIFHPGTGETREFHLENLVAFDEITQFEQMQKQARQAVETGREAATIHLALSGIDLVRIKGGCFSMGDTYGGGKTDEKPVHEVCINDFYLGKYEITQGQWQTVMGNNPSHFRDCGDKCPVENVSWNDTQEFIRRLNDKTRKSYRLPTEAEWEYAAKSGGWQEKYAGAGRDDELDSSAWYIDNSDGRPHPVGQKKHNILGIYDMSGNVWEWCQDWYGETFYRASQNSNPQGPAHGAYRVLRGGAWGSGARNVRATNRDGVSVSKPDSRGFRLAITAP